MSCQKVVHTYANRHMHASEHQHWWLYLASSWCVMLLHIVPDAWSSLCKIYGTAHGPTHTTPNLQALDHNSKPAMRNCSPAYAWQRHLIGQLSCKTSTVNITGMPNACAVEWSCIRIIPKPQANCSYHCILDLWACDSLSQNTLHSSLDEQMQWIWTPTVCTTTLAAVTCIQHMHACKNICEIILMSCAAMSL